MAAMALSGLATLRRLSLVAGVPLTALAWLESLQMDPDKVSEVAKVWKQLAKDLDAPVRFLEEIPDAAARGWIADDQREFSRVTGNMHTNTKAVRDSFDELGNTLEGVAIAFRVFIWATNIMTVMVAGVLSWALGLSLATGTGYVSVRLYLRWLANAVDKALSLLYASLYAYVTAQVGVMAYLMLPAASMDGMARSFDDVDGWPHGMLRGVDFRTARIDKTANPIFENQPEDGKLPETLQDFKWTAPSRPRTAD